MKYVINQPVTATLQPMARPCWRNRINGCMIGNRSHAFDVHGSGQQTHQLKKLVGEERLLRSSEDPCVFVTENHFMRKFMSLVAVSALLALASQAHAQLGLGGAASGAAGKAAGAASGQASGSGAGQAAGAAVQGNTQLQGDTKPLQAGAAAQGGANVPAVGNLQGGLQGNTKPGQAGVTTQGGANIPAIGNLRGGAQGNVNGLPAAGLQGGAQLQGGARLPGNTIQGGAQLQGGLNQGQNGASLQGGANVPAVGNIQGGIQGNTNGSLGAPQPTFQGPDGNIQGQLNGQTGTGIDGLGRTTAGYRGLDTSANTDLATGVGVSNGGFRRHGWFRFFRNRNYYR